MVDDYETIDLAVYFRILWAAKWRIAIFSLIVGIVTLGYLLTLPNIYRASAVIRPEIPDANRGSSGLSALASLGVPVGGPSRAEDLEVLLKSDDLTVRVFRKHDLWQVLLGDYYDPKTKSREKGWRARLFSGGKEAEPLGDWDAIREGKAGLKVSSDRKTGVITVAFESRSPDVSATIVRYYLDEAKSRLQEEALSRANQNKEFIQGQISKTVDALTRDRLYALYGQEVEREMLAKNREQFGFTVIDSPKVPDRKSGPRRSRGAILATFLSFIAACGLYLLRGDVGKRENPIAGMAGKGVEG